MLKSSRKRSRKSKLVPLTYVDLNTNNEKLQPPTPGSSASINQDQARDQLNETPPLDPAAIPFTVKVEVDSGDDDEWWKELEEQAKKKKYTSNNENQEVIVDSNLDNETHQSCNDGSADEAANKAEKLEKNVLLKQILEVKSKDPFPNDLNETSKMAGESAILKLKDATRGSKEAIPEMNSENLFPNENNEASKVAGESTILKPKQAGGSKEAIPEVNSENPIPIVVMEEKVADQSTVIQLRQANSDSKEATITKVQCGTTEKFASRQKKRKKKSLEDKKVKVFQTKKRCRNHSRPSAQYYANTIYEGLKQVNEKEKDFKIISYKCYSCQLCCEFYSSFILHLNTLHKQFALCIAFEITSESFVHVIAFQRKRPNEIVEFKDDFPYINECKKTIFKCLKCKQSFDTAHDLNIHKEQIRVCVCNFKGLCYKILEHQGSCNNYNYILYKSRLNLIHSCIVCEYKFPDQNLLTKHEVEFHQVRSDEFAIQTLTKCEVCSKLYAGPKMVHFCPSLKDTVHCDACGRQFQNSFFLVLHLQVYKGISTCRLCCNVMKSCVKEEHDAIFHDSEFCLQYKCNICSSIYSSKLFLSEHIDAVHGNEELHSYIYTTSKVLLPKKNIQIDKRLCRIVTSDPLANEDDNMNVINKAIAEDNIDDSLADTALVSHYDVKIARALEILETAIKHRVLHVTNLAYECDLCKISWARQDLYKSHLTDLHFKKEKVLLNIDAEYISTPKVIATSLTNPKETFKNEPQTDISNQKIQIVNTIDEAVYRAAKLGLDQEHVDQKFTRVIASFKCYICFKCWEHYSNFKKHFKNHSNIKLVISLEVALDTFVSIVASTEMWEFQDDLQILDASGFEIFKCFKCKQEFVTKADLDEHKNAMSICIGCGLIDHCFSIKFHEGVCSKYFDKVRFQTCQCGSTCQSTEQMNSHRVLCKFKGSLMIFNCPVCSTNYPMIELLMQHQIAWHQVRSDEFAIVKDRLKCNRCGGIYVSDRSYHNCRYFINKVHCKWCNQQFNNEKKLELHIKAKSNVKGECESCVMILDRECMRAEHDVLYHDSESELVYKCNLCEVFNLSKSEALEHFDSKHKESEKKLIVYPFKQIIVPNNEINKDVDGPLYFNGQAAIGDDGTDVEVLINQSIRIVEPIAVTANDSNKVTVIIATEHRKDVELNETGKESKEDTQFKDTTAKELIEDVEFKDTINEQPKEDKQLKDTTSEQPTENLEHTTAQSYVLQPDSINTNFDNNKEMILLSIKEEPVDVTENAPDLLDDSSEPDEFRLIIKEEEPDESIEGNQLLENAIVVKNEIIEQVKSEPTEYEEMIVFQEYEKDMDESDQTIDQFIKNNSEITLAELESEILMKESKDAPPKTKRKVKIYGCKKCNFKGIHREYRDHLDYAHTEKELERKMRATEKKYKLMWEESEEVKCTKCDKMFKNIYLYFNHLKCHGIPHNACPECKEPQHFTHKLRSHVSIHIRKNFVKIHLIDSGKDRNDEIVTDGYNCIKCKGIYFDKDTLFQHWESHFDFNQANVKVTNAKSETKAKSETNAPSEVYVSRKDSSQAVTTVPNSIETKNKWQLDPEIRNYLIESLLTKDDYNTRKLIDRKTCQLCKRHFHRFTDIKRHWVQHLFDEARENKVVNDGMKCPICEEIYQKAEAFKKHMRDHGSLAVYQCHICDKAFSDASNFAKHKKVHGLRVLICDVCTKKFHLKKQLETHMIMHMTQQPLVCGECGKEFDYVSLYNKHLKRYHPKGGDLQPVVSCSVCRERFGCLRDKWDHEWEVHKQRKTKADCPMCGVKFRKFHDVKTHIRTAHSIAITKTKTNYLKLLDTLSKYNVPAYVIQQLLQASDTLTEGETSGGSLT